jgi:hypothetical protein
MKKITKLWSAKQIKDNEKLTVTQLVKQFPAFYRVHNSPPLVPILSQMHPARTFSTYLIKI